MRKMVYCNCIRNYFNRYFSAKGDFIIELAGIIAEYNPFHNGHLYHIQETRRRGATHIAVVMSGSFVQRGDIAIWDKFTRARHAVEAPDGADLVLELPVVYSLAPAEQFAWGAVSLLNRLNCQQLSFGAECSNVALLQKAAQLAEIWAMSSELKALLETGKSYPAAMAQMAENSEYPDVGKLFKTPNNLLGLSYLRAIKSLECSGEVGMNPIMIQRKEVEHDSRTIKGCYASASLLRELLRNGDSIQAYVPEHVEFTAKKIPPACLSYAERSILSCLRQMSKEEFASLPDVGQGLEGRLYQAAQKAISLDTFLFGAKTKRYPLAKLRRIMLAAWLRLPKGFQHIEPPYGRILALNQRGTEILAKASKGRRKKLILGASPKFIIHSDSGELAQKFFHFESTATDLWALCCQEIQPAGQDYTKRIYRQ